MNFSSMDEAYRVMTRGKFGKMYFVDEENGSDSNDGKSPDRAFATIEKACGLTGVCKDDYSDDALYYVFVAPGNYAEDDILFAGHGLHLIGIGQPGRDSGVHVIGEAGAAYCVFGLAAANCEIANICFEAEGAEPVFYAPAMDNCWIHNCRFYAKSGTTLDCMELKDTRNSIIEDNHFFSFEEKGIHHITGADKYCIESVIRRNLFGKSSEGVIGSGAKGIFFHVDTVVYGTLIERNWLLMGDVAGSPIGIDIDSTGQIMICDNKVSVPTGKTPIECAASPTGILHNATQAGAVEVDPNTAAG